MATPLAGVLAGPGGGPGVVTRDFERRWPAGPWVLGDRATPLWTGQRKGLLSLRFAPTPGLHVPQQHNTLVCVVSKILTCPWTSGLFLSVRREKAWHISPLLKFSTMLQTPIQFSILEFCVHGLLPSVPPYVFNQSSIDYGFEIHLWCWK